GRVLERHLAEVRAIAVLDRAAAFEERPQAARVRARAQARDAARVVEQRRDVVGDRHERAAEAHRALADEEVRVRAFLGARRERPAGRDRAQAQCPRPQRGKSHAAPRTPLESPCCARTIFAATKSLNTCSGKRAAIACSMPGSCDSPPPSTIASGSITLITDA